MGILNEIITDLNLFIPTCILNESIGLDKWDLKTITIYEHIKSLEELKNLLTKLFNSSKLSKKDKKIIKNFIGIENER